MDFANTIRVLIGPERNETAASDSSASVTGDATERGLSMAMSRPAIQLKEIMSLIRFVFHGLHYFNKNFSDN